MAEVLLLAVAALAAFGCDPEVPPEPPPRDAGTPLRCGNGRLESDEQCDGTSWSARRCNEVNPAYAAGGELRCNAPTCTFDTRGCIPAVPSRCGDGVVEGNEECEPGSDAAAPSCEDLVPDGLCNREVTCDQRTCRWTIRGPSVPRSCGNVDGTVEREAGEQCDGDDLAGLTCQHLSDGFGSQYSGGTLSCDTSCTLDTRRCWGPSGEHCGNGIRELNEACDGDDLGDKVCRLEDGKTGSYACRPDCTVDPSGCERIPDPCFRGRLGSSPLWGLGLCGW